MTTKASNNLYAAKIANVQETDNPFQSYALAKASAHTPIVMPTWWTPEQQFAIRNRIGGIAATYPTQLNALDGFAMQGDRIVTADLDSGAEVPA